MNDLENKDLNGQQPEAQPHTAPEEPAAPKEAKTVPQLTLEPDPVPPEEPVSQPHITGSAAEPFHMPDPPHAPEPPREGPAYQQGYTQPDYSAQYQPPEYKPPEYGPSGYGGQAPQQPYYQAPYVAQPPAGYQQKSRLAAGLLAITLGIWGVHNFYLGYIGRGAAQIILTLVVGALTCGASTVAVLIWSFVEGVLLLSGSSSYLCDANGVVLRD